MGALSGRCLVGRRLVRLAGAGLHVRRSPCPRSPFMRPRNACHALGPAPERTTRAQFRVERESPPRATAQRGRDGRTRSRHRCPGSPRCTAGTKQARAPAGTEHHVPRRDGASSGSRQTPPRSSRALCIHRARMGDRLSRRAARRRSLHASKPDRGSRSRSGMAPVSHRPSPHLRPRRVRAERAARASRWTRHAAPARA